MSGERRTVETASERPRRRDGVDVSRLPLTEAEAAASAELASGFPVRAPAGYLERIDWSDPHDPLRRQVIPSPDELSRHPAERADPIGDERHSPVPRLSHRYPDRVLLYPTYDCAVHCRHCFRREARQRATRGFSRAALAPALAYVSETTELREVILTGGDPWMLADAELAWLREQLQRMPHLRLLRLHTRIPAVLPERVTDEAVAALRGPLMVCVVTHFNHPREITPAARDACRRLREAGFLLRNQSVLLRGVNDDAATLATLFRDLVYELGAAPYYLHHCDLARGLSHLRTTIDEGRALLRRLRGRVSGLCVPHYVLDLPGGDGKVPLGPSYEEGREAHRWLFRSWLGETHAYEEAVAVPREATTDPVSLATKPPEIA